jgi:imidazolonepropionase-like amidohydrolase
VAAIAQNDPAKRPACVNAAVMRYYSTATGVSVNGQINIGTLRGRGCSNLRRWLWFAAAIHRQHSRHTVASAVPYRLNRHHTGDIAMNHSIKRFVRATRLLVPLLSGLTLASCGGSQPAGTAAPASSSTETGPAAVRYVADRIIVGDGRVIEPGMLEVRDGLITAVGEPPTGGADGAGVVDLRGMTVMPTLVDAHVHLSTNRADLLSDLRQRAAVGVSAALSMGTDPDDALLALRQDPIAGAARYLSAGRGITMPEPGRSDVPHWITNEAEARQAVRDEAARDVDIIKIWVDDRNGQYDKLSPALYSAIIEEAHAQGLRVAAHIFALEDGKGLLRAGVDVFAHGVRNRDIDDEFIELVQAHPDVVLIPNLPGRGVPTDLGWLRGIVDDAAFAQLEARNVADSDAQEFYGIQARNLARLSEAGMTIAMGTDGNTFWAPHVEMEDMVIAGMEPADVIVAATGNSAMAVGLEDTGVLEAGKRADFIVLGSNPLDDITHTRDIVDVFLAGERVAR